MTASTTTRVATNGRGIRIFYPMANDLGQHTITTVVDAAHGLWPSAGLELQPGKAKTALKAADRIDTWAAANDVDRLADLTGDTCGRMLRDLTGAKALTSSKQRDKLHLYRNIVSALRGVVLITDPTLTRRNHERPREDSLAAGLPDLPDRQVTKGRPLTDDEILLTRTLVHIALRERTNPRVVIAYLMAESGVQQMPSTKLKAEHLNDRVNPTKVTCDNVWAKFKTHATRTITLDNFTSPALARALTGLQHDATPLTYTGLHPGTRGAAASLSPVLARYLARAGVTTSEVTPMSPNLWRAYRVLTVKNNIVKAREIYGAKTQNLLDAFKATTDECDLHRGLLHIVDRATGARIATVPAADAYDAL